MKGITGEILAFVIIAISVLVLAVFFSAEYTLKGGEVIVSVTERKIDESANNAIFSLFSNRVEEIQKTYLEVMIDSCLQNETGTEAFYGQALGTILPEEIIPPLFDRYIGKNRWELVLKIANCSITYGDLGGRRILYKYFTEVPYPAENRGNITLHVG